MKSRIFYDINDNIFCSMAEFEYRYEQKCYPNILHHNKENKPSIVAFGKNGEIIFCLFCQQDIYIHRTDGPAKINYEENTKEYWINNIKLSAQEVFIMKAKKLCEE